MILMQRVSHWSGITDMASRWHFLKKGMEHIFTRLEEGLTYTKYMDLYTYVPGILRRANWFSVIYNFCTHNKMTGDAPHIHSGPVVDRQQRGIHDIFKFALVHPNATYVLRMPSAARNIR